MTNYFTKEGVWWGGFYELAFELGDRSDERLSAALSALWSHPSLDGCYLDREKEPSEQVRVDAGEHTSETTHLQGLVTLPNGKKIACGSVNIREESGPDWLDFYIPLAALGEAYPVGPYPFHQTEVSSKGWQSEIDSHLVGIARLVYSALPFRLALVGWEVSGESYAIQLTQDGIPEERYEGYLWPSDGKLEWYPPNVWPIMTMS
ncbi:MAG TPA: hypothetical protein VFD63_23070 [Pyrinomonadaceae bacterium]|nr:hypothetical protein [Pyrinomonadaceae bacterium]